MVGIQGLECACHDPFFRQSLTAWVGQKPSGQESEGFDFEINGRARC